MQGCVRYLFRNGASFPKPENNLTQSEGNAAQPGTQRSGNRRDSLLWGLTLIISYAREVTLAAWSSVDLRYGV